MVVIPIRHSHEVMKVCAAYSDILAYHYCFVWVGTLNRILLTITIRAAVTICWVRRRGCWGGYSKAETAVCYNLSFSLILQCKSAPNLLIFTLSSIFIIVYSFHIRQRCLVRLDTSHYLIWPSTGSKGPHPPTNCFGYSYRPKLLKFRLCRSQYA